MDLLKIILKNGKATYEDNEVILNMIQNIILKGKGEGGYVLIRKEHLKYKSKDDREDNKQNPTRSLHS